jgi:putative membrane protein
MLIGIALTVGVVRYVGAGGLLSAVARVGWGGFALYGLYNLAVFLPLGLAWWSVAPGAGWGRWLVFPWGRLFLVGVRAVQQWGLAEAVVVGSLIVDLTTEMASQLVYTVFGAAMLAAMLSHATGARSLFWITLGALGLGAVLLCAFVSLQGRSVDMVASLAARWLKDTRSRADAVQAVLKTVYAEPKRLGSGVLLHGAAWVASAIGSWLALWLMGAHRPLWQVLTLESLIAAVKSIAFMTPGALGFQEGAYVLVGPLFGLGPESALALSLIKRAKDLAIGAPALLIWQVGEGRRLLLKS